MILPVPINIGGEIYNEVEIKKPTPGVIADTEKVKSNGSIYSALLTFISGSIASIKRNSGTVITDRTQFKSILKWIPFISADFLAIQIVILYNGKDTGIEGIYPCPRCGQKIIAEQQKDGEGNVEFDTLDYLDAMPLKMMSNGNLNIEHELSEPVEIKDEKDTILQSIRKVKLIQPCLQHCINASQRYGMSDLTRLQLAIYVEALTEVDDKEIDQKWKNRWGMYCFENMPNVKDLIAISEKINQYGYDNRVLKTCPACGKQWKAVINTSNFFDSALQLS